MAVKIGKIYITPGFILIAAAVYFFDTWILFPSLVLAVAVHEMGHLAALRLCGARCEKLYLQCVGFRADYNGAKLSYREEIFAAAAGPLASLFLAGAAAIIGEFAGMSGAFFVSGISLILFFYNILPLRPLDGGQIVHMAAALIAGSDAAEKISTLLDHVILFFMFMAGIALLLKSGGNFTLLLATILVVKSRKIV